jgi:hypothetical protein
MKASAMKNLNPSLLAFGLLGCALSGCASRTPNFDAHFGQTVRTLTAQQTLRPAATEANRDRVPEGLEGRAARETIERYQRSFEAAPAQNQYQNFMVGGSGAGQPAR